MTTHNATALRIIDANLNRAREALRVMEDYARFDLDDAGLSFAVKDLRHALVECTRKTAGPSSQETSTLATAEFGQALLAQRDIDGDVGRGIKADSERYREGPLAVAETAAKRLSEALRSVEEYGKTVNRPFAEAIERIRYRGYDLERRLLLHARVNQRFGHVRLYVVLTESLCAADWFSTAQAALRGGADCLQLREKNLNDRLLLDRAKRLAALCREHGAIFIVNDRPDIARLSGADGVHLGSDDLSIAAARRILPAHAIVGVSTHTIEQVQAVAALAPDYIAVGPMFPSSTKPQGYIAGLETLAAGRESTSLPLVAIGGISERNAASVLAAESCTLCVCSAVIAQSDAQAAAARLRAVADECYVKN